MNAPYYQGLLGSQDLMNHMLTMQQQGAQSAYLPAPNWNLSAMIPPPAPASGGSARPIVRAGPHAEWLDRRVDEMRVAL